MTIDDDHATATAQRRPPARKAPTRNPSPAELLTVQIVELNRRVEYLTGQVGVLTRLIEDIAIDVGSLDRLDEIHTLLLALQ